MKNEDASECGGGVISRMYQKGSLGKGLRDGYPKDPGLCPLCKGAPKILRLGKEWTVVLAWVWVAACCSCHSHSSEL